MRSDGSRKSIRSSGYGQQSNTSINSPANRNQGYAGKQGVNRVRRDGPTFNSGLSNSASKAGSRSNLHSRGGMQRDSSRKSFGGSSAGYGPKSDRSRSNDSDRFGTKVGSGRIAKQKPMNKFVNNTRTIQAKTTMQEMNQQAFESENNIDDKISKLQSLLAMAKSAQ